MNKNTKIIQRIMKTKTEDVLHSSAYADIQNAGNFGATSGGDSFAQRLSIEDRRRFVQGYRNSRIIAGAGQNMPRPKAFTPPTPQSTSASISRFSDSSSFNSVSARSTPKAPRIPSPPNRIPPRQSL